MGRDPLCFIVFFPPIRLRELLLDLVENVATRVRRGHPIPLTGFHMTVDVASQAVPVSIGGIIRNNTLRIWQLDGWRTPGELKNRHEGVPPPGISSTRRNAAQYFCYDGIRSSAAARYGAGGKSRPVVRQRSVGAPDSRRMPATVNRLRSSCMRPHSPCPLIQLRAPRRRGLLMLILINWLFGALVPIVTFCVPRYPRLDCRTPTQPCQSAISRASRNPSSRAFNAALVRHRSRRARAARQRTRPRS
jgi:hypothetical protein